MALSKIGIFEILAEIAAGRCGTIYKAVEPSSQRTVALRVIPPSQSPDVARLQNSLHAAALLSSPNIGTVHETFLDNGSLVVVMEYVEGRVLRNLLCNQTVGHLELADFSRQIGMALDHAKSRGVVHRNLHPGNIIQEWDGALRLMDYGLLVNPLAPDSLRYISPEQALGSEPDSRSNLFSWAAVLYEAALGKKAFEGDTAEAVLNNIKSATFAPPESVKAKLNPGFCAFISKALSLRPEDRYQTGAELVRALETCTKAVAVKVAVAATPKAPEKQLLPASMQPFQPPVITASKPAPAVEPKSVPPPLRPPAPPVFAAAKPAPAMTQPTPPQVATPRPPIPPKSSSIPVDPPKQAAAPVAPAPITPVTASPSPAPTSHEPAAAPNPSSEFFVIESKAPVASAPTRPAPAPKPKPKKPSPAFDVNKFLALANSKEFMLGASALLLVAVLALAVSFVRHRRSEPPPATPAQAVAPEPAPVAVEAPPPDTPAEPSADNTQPLKPRARKDKKVTVAALPVMTTGELVIESIPTGASVQVDGRSFGVTPIAVSQLLAGQHVVTLSLAGHESVSRNVEVAAGARHNVALQLAEMQATVAITSTPAGASIFINGKDSGKATPATMQLPKGHYSLSLKMPGFVDFSSTFDTVPGESVRLAPQLTALANAQELKEAGKLKRMFGGSTAGLTKVRIRTNPKGAQIDFNQRRLNKTSPTEIFAPPGVYDLTISLQGYKTIQKRITISGAEATLDETLER